MKYMFKILNSMTVYMLCLSYFSRCWMRIANLYRWFKSIKTRAKHRNVYSKQLVQHKFCIFWCFICIVSFDSIEKCFLLNDMQQELNIFVVLKIALISYQVIFFWLCIKEDCWTTFIKPINKPIIFNFQIPTNVTSQLGLSSIYCWCKPESSDFITCK